MKASSDGQRSVKARWCWKSFRAKTTVAEASRAYDLSPSEVESWVEDGKRGMENALQANPQDVEKQYERQINELQEAYRDATPACVRGKKYGPPRCCEV